MLREQPNGGFQQDRVIALMNPAASARRMRQRYDEPPIDDVRLSNDPIERLLGKESSNRELAHRNDDSGPDDPELAFEPTRAGVLLLRRRYAIATAAWARSRIATGHRRDVDLPPRRDFIDASP